MPMGEEGKEGKREKGLTTQHARVVKFLMAWEHNAEKNDMHVGFVLVPILIRRGRPARTCVAIFGPCNLWQGQNM